MIQKEMDHDRMMAGTNASYVLLVCQCVQLTVYLTLNSLAQTALVFPITLAGTYTWTSS